MAVYEPNATALALLVIGAFLVTSALLSRLWARSGVPLVLGFVALGMAAGAEGIGRFVFDNYRLSFRIGTSALVLILFDAGLHTPRTTFRRYLAPSVVLATIGVLGTAAMIGGAAHALGFDWTTAFLLGAIVSSTDAAAVFSVLRVGGVELHERVGALLEVESGLNDPMAVILTLGTTEALAMGQTIKWTMALFVGVQLGVGAAVGMASGVGARLLLKRLQLSVTGLYPVLTVGLAFVAFGVASVLQGSGFLAVYLAGIVLGDAKLSYKAALGRVHDFVAWLGQVAMFVVLGLLASPARIVQAAGPGLVLAFFVAFVARPVAVIPCVLPFGFRAREVLFVSWVGLKGAVPIVLACIPVLAHVTAATRIFDLVFFIVVVGATIQGSTVSVLARKLKVGRRVAPTRPAALEITASRPLGHELVVCEVNRASAVCSASLSDIPFPDDAAVMLVVRGADLLAPRGHIVLEEGDILHIFCRSSDLPMLNLLFGQHES
ncbi:MAG: potassium/proton antiporter [Polyangiaceae bacterium]|nr:potassium/proton antiporter [Polyangiaceae bacterium]